MVKANDNTKDQPKTAAAKTGSVFFLLGKKRRAIKVPKGMEKKIGVKKAMPKSPYFFTVLTATTFFMLSFEFSCCLLDIQEEYLSMIK